jgi:Ca2+-binding RTX toxin-like protein
LVNANDQLSVKNWFSSGHYYIEQINFSTGTAWTVDTILSTAILSAGSANADSLSGWHGVDRLEGGDGNDTLRGGGGNDSLLGGSGNDSLDGGSGDDLLDGGDGNDLISDDSGLNSMRGGAGNDSIRGRGSFVGGSGDDLLQASDPYFGDTYLFQLGDGKDAINDFGYGGMDRIVFGAGINPSALPLHRVGLDLLFLVNANDQLSVRNWFSSGHYYIEQINFSTGTAWTVDTILSTAILSAGSANADSLSGWQGMDRLEGGEGNDSLSGGGGNDSLFGGSGNDSLDGGSGDDLLDGGDGNDLISDDSGLNSLRGGAGNDSIRGRGSFAGGSGDDLLQASDPYFGDTYLFQLGDGKDAINDFGYGGMDRIVFGAGINPSTLPLHRVGLDLLFLVNANDQLSVKNWFSSGHYYIEQINFSTGTAWTVDTILSTAILSAGSANADSLSGWQGMDRLEGGEGNDSLSGGGGNDSLFGGSGNDSLDGGSGDDLLDGGDGNDLISDDSGLNSLRGGAGNDSIRGRGSFAGGSGDDLLQASDPYFGDTYLFQIGDGKDAINDFGYGGMDRIVFGAGINPSTLPLHRVGLDLLFLVNANDQLSVRNWFSSGHYYIEQINFSTGTAWTVDTILSTAILSAGSANADSLSGWQGMDRLEGGEGNDSLSGGGGNDSLFGGSGNDSLSGEAGDDLLDGGDGNDLISDDSGLNSLRGGAGNDSIRGRGSFVGGSGDDLLQASDPYFGDTYLYQLGDGKDAINDFGYGGTDTIVFGGGINASMLWFQKSGADLEVTRIGSTEGVSIKNWYTTGHQQIERFRSADGKILANTNVDALVRQMAAFSPPPLGQTGLSGDYVSALGAVIAANWL